MAAPSGSTNPGVVDRLGQQPYRFEFFQAVRLLHLLAAQQASPELAHAAIGHSSEPSQEVVRLRGWPGHHFAAAEVCGLKQVAVENGKPRRQYEMSISLMGLYGTQGVLPRHYSQMVVMQTRHEPGHPLKDFLDCFNHRILSYYFRAWEKYRIAIGWERARVSNDVHRTDLFTMSLFALCGLRSSKLRNRVLFRDDLFAEFAGLLSHHPRNWLSLQRVLQHTLGLSLNVHQFQGQWLSLSNSDQSSLPTSDRPSGINAKLGQETVIGSRIWNTDSKIRVRIGPLSIDQFRRFMPGRPALIRLAQLVRQYCELSIDFDVQIVLTAPDVPPLELTSEGTAPPQLGLNCWLISRTPAEDKDEAVFEHAGFPLETEFAY